MSSRSEEASELEEATRVACGWRSFDAFRTSNGRQGLDRGIGRHLRLPELRALLGHIHRCLRAAPSEGFAGLCSLQSHRSPLRGLVCLAMDIVVATFVIEIVSMCVFMVA